MIAFRFFESGYFEPFFDALFELEDEPAETDVLGTVVGWSRVVFPFRRRIKADLSQTVDDEEALIALLLAATR